MRLSELVKTRNFLQELSVTAVQEVTEELDGKLNRIRNLPLHLDYQSDLDHLLEQVDKIEHQLEYIEETIPKVVAKINQELAERTKDFYARGYMINGFYGSNSTDVATERQDRLLPMSQEVYSEVLIKIRSYTDWRYPTLEIGPGDGQWTEHLVAGDPLYIIDVHKEFLDSALSKFTFEYRNRVRPYLTGPEAGKSDTDLSELPRDQFGFVFAWNVFDYFPLEHIKAFLSQSYEMLRPGGIMMFSYNNCDVPQCAEYVQQGFRSWMTEQLLLETCRSFGFEIVASVSKEMINWVEVKKPGTLKTVKAHQVMGEIISR
jgi:phospholipid N-methyltransferase